MTVAPLALTLGEPAGIGPEIALKAWSVLRKGGPAFALFGDAALLQRRARTCGLEVPLRETTLAEASAVFQSALPVVPLQAPVPDRPGLPDPAGAPAVLEAIDRAVEAAGTGAARAVVTNPIQKSSLYAAGFRHPGHTEYLGELSARLSGRPRLPVMMLACDVLRVVPVTIHIPLAEVSRRLDAALIAETARIVVHDLRERFGIAAPRLAIAGLNPHAGEGGALGSEDAAVVRPAVEALQAEGIAARGPLPADTMFHAEARARYDAALCMYHDQALIPIKTLAFDEGVNVTLGLSFVRTSPDHGTALDIAGTGRARETSLVAALRLADRLSRPA